jgi:hypothetical protein
MFCTNCGAQLAEDARFCIFCGKTTSPSEAATDESSGATQSATAATPDPSRSPPISPPEAPASPIAPPEASAVRENPSISPAPLIASSAAPDRSGAVSDVTFDLLSVLHNSLEALTALQRYKADAAGDPEVRLVFERLERGLQETVTELRRLLRSRL